MYLPEIGRWGVIDLLAEKYMPISPYAYALNNPIVFVDHEMTATFGENGDAVEDDANAKAATLTKNHEGINYLFGQTPIKENGKEIPKK